MYVCICVCMYVPCMYQNLWFLYFIVYFQIEALSIKYLSIFTISPQAFQEDHTNLRELSLSRNLLDEVPTDALAILHKLQKLDLSFNNISIIRNGSFLNLSSLTELILTSNQLHTIEDDGFSGVKSSLRYLRLNNNSLLKSCPRTSAFPQLFSMDLSQCSIENLTMYGDERSSMEILNLGNNNIYFIDQLAFQYVVKLNLNDNHIHGICFGMFATLNIIREIILSRNRVNVISRDCFRNISSLKLLDLSSNNISDLHNHAFIGLPNLKTLAMRDNLLTSLGNSSFIGLVSLRTLILDLNHIHHISVFTFQCLPKLKRLYLQKNMLMILMASVFDNSFLNRGNLYIDGNPLNCNCEHIWFRNHPFHIGSKAKCFNLASNQSFSLTSFPLSLCLNESVSTTFQTLTTSANGTVQSTNQMHISLETIIVICSCFGLLFISIVSVAVIRLNLSHPAQQ